MANPILVTVLKSIHELQEIISCNRLFESSSHCDEIEKFTSLCKLKDNIVNCLGSIFLVVSSLSIFDGLNDILMLKFAHCLNFCHQEFFFLISHIIVHDFHSNLSVGVWVNSKLYFATCTCSQSSFDRPFSNCSWHLCISFIFKINFNINIYILLKYTYIFA